MIRRTALAVAVISGLAAALLLVWGPTVEVDGETADCAGIIATAEGGGEVSAPAGSHDARLAAACADRQQRWAWYAGGLLVLCVAAGSGARFARRPADAGPEPVEERHPVG